MKILRSLRVESSVVLDDLREGSFDISWSSGTYILQHRHDIWQGELPDAFTAELRRPLSDAVF